MYDYGDLFALSCATSDSFGHPAEIATAPLPEFFPAVAPPPPPLHPLVAGRIISNEYESVSETLAALKSEVGNSSICSSYGSPSSLPSYYTQRPSLFQRSMSSHSLPKDGFHHPHPFFWSLDETGHENFDLENEPMRKVFSTGDLQMINLVQHSLRSESPLSNENCAAEGTNKVRCYSPEERKERIERYRSKRSQRNFNKKIKYACRKTLADSRPRIRGRFARNDEIGESCQTQWSQMGGDEDEDEDDVWSHFLNAFSSNLVPS